MSVREILTAYAQGKLSRSEASLALYRLRKQGAAKGARAPHAQVSSAGGMTSHAEDARQEGKHGAAHEGGIAVIGMAARFPGASDLQQFWGNLAAGVNCVKHIPEQRWSLNVPTQEVSRRKETESRHWAGLLEGIENFDPLFFGISPKESSYMDPQQRLFLEEAWSALEDAAYSPRRLSGIECGVFVGVGPGDYQQKLHREAASGDAYALLGNTASILTGRLSYILNLRGPSVAIDTACSSSLVAIHQACLSLKVGECEMAIAGGVSVMTTPQTHIMTSAAGMLSPTGKCRAFDNSADGFVASEGVGVIVLKRLDDALRDGDHIRGVILASRTNQDGSTNGITAPSAESQKNLLTEIYRRNGILPSTINYVECHGTGTKLGDPIEFDALTQAFGGFTKERGFCAIGSVKTNIGHCLAAAGVASVIKVLLSLEHGKIPASLHFETPNEHIRFADSPFFVNTELSSWNARHGGKRRAAVSSFGFSGTNAHLVIEEYRPAQRSGRGELELPVVVPLSAASVASLEEYAAKLLRHLESTRDLDIRDIAYTLQVGRKALQARVSFVVSSVEELCGSLKRCIDSDELSRSAGPIDPRLTPRTEVGSADSISRRSFGKDASKLARAWDEGGSVDWEAGYDGGRPLRISLPTYPFRRIRCWFDPPGNPSLRPKLERLASDAAFGRSRGAGLESGKTTSGDARGEEGEGGVADDVALADAAGIAYNAPIADDGTIAQVIKKSLAAALYLDMAEIDEDRDLLKLGVDSITGLEWIREINREFSVALEASSIYSHSTLRQMAGFIYEQLQGRERQGQEAANPVAADPVAADAVAADAVAAEEVAPAAADREPAVAGRGGGATRGRAFDVAVIGVAGRYPMARNLEEFWENLRNGRNCIAEIPQSRWDHEPYFCTDRSRPGKTYNKWGGFIADVDKFDAALFNIAPRDAVMLDPQVRLFMQTTWEAIEDAGYSERELSAQSVGVFVGTMYDHYPLVSGDREKTGIMAATTSWSIANRTSYFFGFQGPSLSLNTACSSSLTAIYLACESIRTGECDCAIAGGVNLSLHHSKWLALSYGGVIGGSSRSMSLGKGDGYIPGEGVGAVVLKPLGSALASNDHIYAVIKGGCINHGGRSKAFSVPNVEAQTSLIRCALERADVPADTIGYVETASSGSVLGDPIEIQSLSAAMSGCSRPIPIGSVKSNIGHLEAASGISQLTKVLLQLRHEMLVPSINSEPLNESINLDGGPFYVQREVAAWASTPSEPRPPQGRRVRRAMINSFGAGGANAHLVVEESPLDVPAAAAQDDDGYYIIPLSALHAEGLRECISRFQKYCEGERFPLSKLRDIAYTLQVGRCDLDHRVAVVARERHELRAKLAQLTAATGAKQIDGVYAGVVRNCRDKPGPFDIEAGPDDTIFTLAAAQLMARRWVGGARIGWGSYYRAGRPARVSLPGYSFKSDRYWVADNEDPASAQPAPTAAAIAVEGEPAPRRPREGKDSSASPSAAVARSAAKRALCEYIGSIVANRLDMGAEGVDRLASFNSFGMDSIMVAEITAELEKDLGRLPKTLFFEYASIDELADYFLENHHAEAGRLLARSGQEAQSGSSRSTPAVGPRDPDSLLADGRLQLKGNTVAGNEARSDGPGERNYGDVYLLDIWKHRFTSQVSKGSVSVLLDRHTLYAAGYKGVMENEPKVLNELHELAVGKGYQVCYWAPIGPHTAAIESLNTWVSVPVAVWQTITGIRSFDLEGGKRRKLRYAVNHFAKSGSNSVMEYRAIDPGVNRAIEEVIHDWAKAKKYVNSVDAVLEDIKSGKWQQRYRIFLTYREQQLQNVIFIVKLSDQGYLMEQEYYRESMPFGGTEFAVVEILRTLAAEGYDTFSLGLTWAIDRDGHCSDPLGQQLIKDTLAKDTFLSRIYEAGAGNLQYKQKFGVANTSINLYRPAASDPKTIIEFLSQFFAHGRSHRDLGALDGEGEGSGKAGAMNRASCGGILAGDVPWRSAAPRLDGGATAPLEFADLVSDSWSYSRAKDVASRTAMLAARSDVTVDYAKIIAQVLGCAHFHLTCSGRIAERLFFRALSAGAPPGARKVLGNILFETTAHNLSSHGYQSVEIPNPGIFSPRTAPIFIGGVDRARMAAELERNAAGTAMLFVELCNNASGGHPISLSELRWMRAIASQYQKDLVIDITRIVTNALLIGRHEDGYSDKSVWEIVREIVQLADCAIGSLSKDFGVSTGGIICARSGETIARISKFAQLEGGGAGAMEQVIIGEALRDLEFIGANVARRVMQVGELGERLEAVGVPVLNRAIAHCVLIPANTFKSVGGTQDPRQALLKWLSERTSIRGGIHSAGRGGETVLHECVRLAVPLGISDAEHHRTLAKVGGLELEIGGASRKARAGKAAVEAAVKREVLQDPAATGAGDIAIIGLSGRFPNAPNVAALWKNIVSGASCISAMPEERCRQLWNGRHAVSATRRVRWGGFMADVDRFDPLFFGISPAEAERMDPQQRLILQTAWAAIEDAGYARAALSQAKTGVFVAIPLAEYLPYDAVTGFGGSIASNRISHLFDFVGPSEVVQTCCSSSFVALHRAIQAIGAGECRTAIVGGVQVLMNGAEFEASDRAGLLSKGAQSHSFDQSADGYVRSECVGAILIKPLDAAIHDNDNIYAVIRGTGVCHGGSGLSISAPSVGGIREAMVQAYRHNHIDPRSIQYIEAHGISSPLGDAVEIEALRQGYRQMEQECAGADPPTTCYIGSLKPNLGHAEFASGMPALFKVIMAMRDRTIPGVTGLQQLNENISLDDSPFVISSASRYWEARRDADGAAVPRRASLSSFGITGVNAHVVVEEYAQRGGPPLQGAGGSCAGPYLFVLSARNPEDLRRRAQDFVEYFRGRTCSPRDLYEIAHTLAVGREAMRTRLAIVHSDAQDLIERLSSFLAMHANEPRDDSPFFAGAADEDRIVGESVAPAYDRLDMSEIARRWVEGEEIEWTRIYASEAIRRVPLPTYPFHGERYWPEPYAGGAAQTQPGHDDEPASPPPLAAAGELAASDQLVEKTVLEAVSTVAKISQRMLAPKVKLRAIGLDSMMLMKVAGAIESRTGLRLSQHELARVVSVRDLTAAVVDGMGARMRGSRIELPCREIEILRPGNDVDAAFWIHGGFGTTQFYNPLASRIGTETPIYAMKAKGLDDDAAPIEDMREIARYYRTIVADISRGRPVHLAGYSQGGIIAYEMARQMQEDGAGINSLVLLDAPFPDLETTKVSVQERYLLVLMNILYMQGVPIAGDALDPALTECSEQEVVHRLAKWGVAAGVRYGQGELEAALTRYYRVCMANETSVVNYRIEKLPEPGALQCVYFARKDRDRFFDPKTFPFRGAAEANRYFVFNDCVSKWKTLVPNLEVYGTGAADHFSLLVDPQCAELIARELNRRYARALGPAIAKRAG